MKDNARGARALDLHAVRRVGARPFDYQRRLSSVLVEESGRREVIVKGAPEIVLERCRTLTLPPKRCWNASSPPAVG